MKIGNHNPGLDLTKAMSRLPKDFDTSEIDGLVAPIFDKANSVTLNS